MRFSVVVPTFNRADVLRRFLEAIAAQTHRDFEVIVVDDGSADRTAQVAQSFPFVKYLQQAHHGTAKLLNVGWRHAAGDVVLTSDDDCIGPPNWLESLAAGFRRYPQVVAVGTYAAPPEHLLATNRFARYDDWEWRHYGGRLTEYVGGEETPTAGLVAYKRAALEAVGGFNESLFMAGAHDHDIKQRLTARGYKFAYLPIKIDHWKPFTAPSFHGQHIGRGRAVVRYELARRGRGPGYVRIGLRALARMARLLKNLVAMPDKSLAWTIFEAEWFNCIGQFQEQTALRREARRAKQP
jgi:glycosyltransferase involved in cell wall biosynthesis